jgi:hypothetical protein
MNDKIFTICLVGCLTLGKEVVDECLSMLSVSRSLNEVWPIKLSGTIIRGTLKTPESQLVTPISTKLQRPDGCD